MRRTRRTLAADTGTQLLWLIVRSGCASTAEEAVDSGSHRRTSTLVEDRRDPEASTRKGRRAPHLVGVLCPPHRRRTQFQSLRPSGCRPSRLLYSKSRVASCLCAGNKILTGCHWYPRYGPRPGRLGATSDSRLTGFSKPPSSPYIGTESIPGPLLPARPQEKRRVPVGRPPKPLKFSSVTKTQGECDDPLLCPPR